MATPDDVLADLARLAFQLGLEHGRTRASPIDRHALQAHLRDSWPDSANRIVHLRKLRQVYGAGFDISAILKRHAPPPPAP